MKKAVTSILVLFITAAAAAQADTTVPYLKNKQLPPFTLLTTDSVEFTPAKLAKNKRTIIMLYNPECGHCQEQMELFLATKEVMDSAQIVLASTQPIYKIKMFAAKYALHKYPNIIVVKDNSWVLGKFFQPRTIPVLAFYNKQQQFVFISQGNATQKQILQALVQ